MSLVTGTSPAFNKPFETLPIQLAAMNHTTNHFGSSAAVHGMGPTVLAVSKNKLGDNKHSTRPLNSWMAFRSHYNHVFQSMQQKDISGFLTLLWQYDPFKAKWTILAKAYSVIRDGVGKNNAPLDKFLAINGPYIGVVATKDYLVTLGWCFNNTDGRMELTREHGWDLASLHHDLLVTNLSVEDVIKHSFAAGYISGDEHKMLLHNDEPTMVMASSSIGNVCTKVNDNIGLQGSNAEASAVGQGEAVVETRAVNGGNNDVRHTNPAYFGQYNHNAGVHTSANTSGVDMAWLDAEIQRLTDQVALDIEAAGLGAEAVGANEAAGGEDYLVDDNPVWQLGSEFFSLEGDYPFDKEFDPSGPDFEFDPFMGDAFNPYNIGDFTDPEDVMGAPL